MWGRRLCCPVTGTLFLIGEIEPLLACQSFQMSLVHTLYCPIVGRFSSESPAASSTAAQLLVVLDIQVAVRYSPWPAPH